MVSCWPGGKAYKGPYHFTVNDNVPHPLSNKTNYIRTTKYTLWSFLPVNLFGQFRRFYNLYFLLGTILSLLPLGVSPISPFTQVVPLVLVLFVTAVKDAVEDYGRFKSDQRANNIEFLIQNEGQSRIIKSKDIRPGDLIYIEKGMQFPADIILVSTSNEEGIAYIETAELDGETNLKKRQALDETLGIASKEQIKMFQASVEADPPDALLYEFRAKLIIGEAKLALNPEQLLLRGSILRNTNFVYGIVCYVGQETKIMKNLKSASLKFSTLEHRLNMLVASIFVLNAILLLISAIVSGFFHRGIQYDAWYISWPASPAQVGAFHAMTYYIIYTYMIPISLFVTIELSRLVQVLFMYWDEGMQSSTGMPMRPRNSNLNEDLGRVEHIFSDKTGTLTQNIMKLRHWYVNGKTFDEPDRGEWTLEKSQDLAESSHSELIKHAKGLLGEAEEKGTFVNFIRAIGVCHSVVPSYDEILEKIVYEGDSPDEAALLEALRHNGVIFTSRNTKGMALDFLGKEEKFEVLQVLEFSSARKRMSVIVRNPEGQLELYCKGADNVIMERRAKGDMEAEEMLETAIRNFSREGLRTLLVAHLPLTEEEFQQFQKEYHEAEVSDHDWKEKVEAVENKIEQNLIVLGATAVEDKLQEEVAETIEYLQKCNIRVWMLTGDKLETAISIGKSTRFVGPDMVLMIIDAEDKERTRKKIESYLIQCGPPKEDSPDHEMRSMVPRALVITGKSLTFALEEYSEEFLLLTEFATSVICCRVSPLQKSQVVKLVKKKSKKVCLSIGDGANDVSMIQVANIGVGIIGLEGTQAVRASDYAFKEFRALRRLVAVHGRYSYIRMSKLIFFSFYKNLTLVYPQFWAGLYMAWSGVSMYHELVLTCFNLVFTSLPPFLLAFLEKDIEITTINQYPEAYRAIQQDDSFNPFRITLWGLSSFYAGTVLYFFMNLWYGEGIRMADGREFGGYFLTSATMSFFVLTTVLIKWAFVVNHWHWPYSFFTGLSYAVFFGFMFLFASEAYVSYGLTTAELGLVSLLLSAPTFYLVLMIAVFLALLPDLVYQYAKRNYFPADYDILQEEEVLSSKPINVASAEKALNHRTNSE